MTADGRDKTVSIRVINRQFVESSTKAVQVA